MVKIYIENSSKFEMPKYAHPGDSGMDIRANIEEPVTLGPLERYIFPTGIKVIIPEGFEIQVRSRSGLAAKRGIAVLNSPGTIDQSFRGEIGVILVNLSNEAQTIEPGERVAQLVVARVETAELEKIEKVPENTERGSGAYGNSGRF
jgi:dUTP pyrophosphatase